MSIILHISDTHFGTEQAPVMAALLQLYEQEKPHLVIASGDITQRARRSQFRAARNFFSKISAPTIVIPGNHDIPLFNLALRIFAPYANYAIAFGKNLQPEFNSNDLLVIGVNTTRAQRHVDGEISAKQIRHVSNKLAGAHVEQLKIVVTHQPVRVITEDDEINLLHGCDAAIEAWADAGVDLILGGHIHLPYVRSLRAENSDRKAWAVQAGTALSSRVRGNVPNSVNIIRYERGTTQVDHTHLARQCSVEQWNYGADSDRFHMALRTELDLTH